MKTGILLFVILILLLAMAVAAPAVTLQTSRNSGQQKENLYQIITAWGFAVDNEALQDATPLESLPAGDYSIQHYARYSGKSQSLGIYPVAITAPDRGDQAPADGSLLLNPKSGNWECDLTFSAMSDFGFFDDSRKTSILLTTQNQNSAAYLYRQSSGLIFDLGEINPLYAGQYIIAFEDGGGKSKPFGDLDYNDLVVHVTALPLPGTLPLVGAGLLCLWIRRSYQRLLASAG